MVIRYPRYHEGTMVRRYNQPSAGYNLLAHNATPRDLPVYHRHRVEGATTGNPMVCAPRPQASEKYFVHKDEYKFVNTGNCADAHIVIKDPSATKAAVDAVPPARPKQIHFDDKKLAPVPVAKTPHEASHIFEGKTKALPRERACGTHRAGGNLVSMFSDAPGGDKGMSERARRAQEFAAEVKRDQLNRKIDLQRQKAEEWHRKRKDNEVLASHNPFGKPGAGAPRFDEDHPEVVHAKRWDRTQGMPAIVPKREDNTKKAKELAEINQRETQKIREQHKIIGSTERDLETEHLKTNPFGKPGGGAPLSNDDELATKRKKLDVRAMDDFTAAPTKPDATYGKELLQQDSKDKRRITHERRNSVEMEQKHIEADVFTTKNKVGGGAPLRNESGGVNPRTARVTLKEDIDYHQLDPRVKPKRDEVTLYAEQLRRQKLDREAKQAKDGDPTSDLDFGFQLGNGVGYAKRDKETGKLQPRRRPVESERPEILNDTRGGGGAPIISDKGDVKASRPHVVSNTATGVDSFANSKQAPTLPFNRPGGGAPIVDAKGKLTAPAGKLQTDISSRDRESVLRQRRRYMQELDQQRKDRSSINTKDTPRSPEGSLLPKVGRGYGYPKKTADGDIIATHKASDIIARPPDFKGNAKDYHDNLDNAIKAKQESRIKERLQTVDQEKAHIKSFTESFGRSGGGAPIMKDGTLVSGIQGKCDLHDSTVQELTKSTQQLYTSDLKMQIKERRNKQRQEHAADVGQATKHMSYAHQGFHRPGHGARLKYTVPSKVVGRPTLNEVRANQNPPMR